MEKYQRFHINLFGTGIGNYFLTLFKLTTCKKSPALTTLMSDVRFFSLAWFDGQM